MKVTEADFSYKQQKEAPKAEGQNGKPAQGNAREKKRIIKKTQKLNKYVRSTPPPLPFFFFPSSLPT